MHSALVALTDTRELFGGEAVPQSTSRTARSCARIDHWDSRSFGAETAAKMQTPANKFPTNFDYDVASESTSAKIRGVAAKARRRFFRGRRQGRRRAV
jgi:hypothetical protein